MCECGGSLVECICGDWCCVDCGCRNSDVMCTDVAGFDCPGVAIEGER